MKEHNYFVRTKDGRIVCLDETKKVFSQTETKLMIGFETDVGNIVKQADTIEELCDELVVKYQNDLPIPQRIVALKKCMELNHITWEEHFNWLFKRFKEKLEWVKLAIYTDKGLIYVAKMNGEGVLELL